VFDTHILLNTEEIFVLLFQSIHHGRNVTGSVVKHVPWSHVSCAMCNNSKCKITHILSNRFRAEQRGMQKILCFILREIGQYWFWMEVSHKNLCSDWMLNVGSQLLCHTGHQKFLKPSIYRVSRGECARLQENVPKVKVHRYNPRHL
jgi:hypothetical protein